MILTLIPYNFHTMPSRHERKEFVAGGLYHIYNRGIDKMEIYHSTDDYAYFERSLTMYLCPASELFTSLKQSTLPVSSKHLFHLLHRASRQKNYSKEIKLLAFCLMPNHFHLLVQQVGERTISQFMKSLQTCYAMYYGKKYGRIGPLFQARYKGIHVKNETYYKTVLNYIHDNPSELQFGTQNPEEYLWSSLRDYLGTRERSWISKATNLNRLRSSKYLR